MRALIIDKFKKGQKMTDEELSIMSGDHVEYLAHKPEPSTPVIIMELRQRQKENIDFKPKKDFWERTEIDEWLARRSEVYCENHSNYRWLQFMRRSLKEGDLRVRTEKLISMYPKEYREYYIANIKRERSRTGGI